MRHCLPLGRPKSEKEWGILAARESARKGQDIYWSQSVLDHGAECGCCFEPSSQCASFLKSRFQGENIKIRELALSDKQGTQLFHEEPDFGATSSLGIRSEHKDAQAREVTVTTLDDEFQNSDLVVDFLKTDCEGWDLKHFKGAPGFLIAQSMFSLNIMYIDLRLDPAYAKQ